MNTRISNLITTGFSGWVMVLVLTGMPAQAMVINANPDETSNPSVNTIAPSDDPGWANVGRFGQGAGISLGHGWVLTAKHFDFPGTITFDNQTFNRVNGTTVPLQNPDPADGDPDLRMFRIDADPGLPTVPIINTSPTADEDLVMIGHGRERISEQKNVRDGPGRPLTGYEHSETSRVKTWGNNRVSDTTSLFTDAGGRTTQAFRTDFDDIQGDAQGTPGDSAGGAFFFNSTEQQWELGGLILATNSFVGQQDNTVAFGNETIFADLSVYRDQIHTTVFQGTGDLNFDGVVDGLDIDLFVQALTDPDSFNVAADLNLDGVIDGTDIDPFVNQLVGTSSEALVASITAIPEPTSLALFAGSALLLLRRRKTSRGALTC